MQVPHPGVGLVFCVLLISQTPTSDHRGIPGLERPDMMFYKFILDSFSTSQFVFHEGRREAACSWRVGVWQHLPPIWAFEELSTLGRAISICATGRLLQCQGFKQGVFLQSSRRSQRLMRVGGAVSSTLHPNCTQPPNPLS